MFECGICAVVGQILVTSTQAVKVIMATCMRTRGKQIELEKSFRQHLFLENWLFFCTR